MINPPSFHACEVEGDFGTAVAITCECSWYKDIQRKSTMYIIFCEKTSQVRDGSVHKTTKCYSQSQFKHFRKALTIV